VLSSSPAPGVIRSTASNRFGNEAIQASLAKTATPGPGALADAFTSNSVRARSHGRWTRPRRCSTLNYTLDSQQYIGIAAGSTILAFGGTNDNQPQPRTERFLLVQGRRSCPRFRTRLPTDARAGSVQGTATTTRDARTSFTQPSVSDGKPSRGASRWRQPDCVRKNATERGFRDGLPISHPAAASTQSLTC